MNNVLIAIPCGLSDKDGFEEVLNKFDEKGFNIHEINDFSMDDIGMEMFTTIYKYLKDYYPQGIDRIVVISNLKDIVFGWYRCFNSIIHDFVYFIDNNTAEILEKHKNDVFFKNYLEFEGVENEFIEGKIYTNMNQKNYKTLANFLIEKGKFIFFDLLSNFEYEKTVKKSMVKKSYYFKNQVIEFGKDIDISHFERNNTVIIGTKLSIPTNISDSYFMQLLHHSTQMFVYLSVEIIESQSQVMVDYFCDFYRLVRNNFPDKAKILFEQLSEFFEKSDDIKLQDFEITLLLTTLKG